MAHVALGVANSGTDGTTAQDMRLMLGALYGNTGVISGLSVNGGSTLAYTVSAGVAVCSRGTSDGKTIAYTPGGSVATTANSGSNPRIDLVWIKADDLSHGDSDNLVTLGCTQGTAAASPVAPDAPAGCTVLATMRMPAGATTTAGATSAASVDYAIPYGSTLGILGETVNTANAAGDTKPGATYTQEAVTFHLPTDRIVQISYSACFSNSIDGWCSWGVYAFLLDGKAIPGTTCEWLAEHGTWSDHEFSVNVEVPSGSHTVAVRNGLFSNSGSGVGPVFHYGLVGGSSSSKGGYTGRTLRVTDLGPAR